MIRRIIHSFSFSWLFLIISCINSDTVEGPKSDPVLMLEPLLSSLLINETKQLVTVYTNENEEIITVTPTFTNLTPDLLSVNESGFVIATASGKGRVFASFMEVNSDTAIINVVDSEDDVASIIVSGPKSNLDIDEEITLTAMGYNINDVEIPGLAFTWSSQNSNLATVDEMARVKAISKGVTEIIATADGIEGYFPISIDLSTGKATLMGSSGYTAKGTAELSLSGSDIMLTLSNDFEASFALGTFIYLANSTNGSEVKSSGFEVAEVTTNGSHTFNITDIAKSKNTMVALGEHKYVIILCKPASITFGYGELIF